MHKTTLYLDESTRLSLKELANRQGRKQADVIREAVAAYLVEQERPKPRGVGHYRSGRSDIAERAEEILAERPRPGAPHDA